MFRIDTPNKAVDLFGAGKHGFRDGDMALGVNPTELSAAQQNALQEEILGVIEAAGVVPNKANNAQLVEALQLIIDSRGNVVGKNKLLNTNFEVPVNQLGKATRVTTAGAYNFDQWYYGSDSKFYQPADYVNLSASQQYTLSWVGTATAEYKFATVRSSGIVADAGAWTAIASGGNITTPADVITGAKFLWIRWTGVTSALATFDKPQLEEGAATTYERKLYDQVLRECQRYLPYFDNTSGGGNVFSEGVIIYNTSHIFCFLTFPVAARFKVTGLVTVAAASYNLQSASINRASSSAPSLNGVPNNLMAEVVIVDSGISYPAPVRVTWANNSYLYFTGAQI